VFFSALAIGIYENPEVMDILIFKPRDMYDVKCSSRSDAAIRLYWVDFGHI
jgi:hypothetical protein